MITQMLKEGSSRMFLDLGKTPPANKFLEKEGLKHQEEFFPLRVCFNEKLKLVHLDHIVPKEKLFSHYVYVTSTSKTFRDHFTKMADTLGQRFRLKKDSLAVDIGSNDGILLQGLKKYCNIVGIEPASNIAALANSNGIETINDFLTNATVETIIKEKGHADVVCATNVFAHTENITEFVELVKKLLKPDGAFVIEIQYFLDTIETMTFDNIYHEHLYYYTVTSLQNFFNTVGMTIFDIEHVDTHGGSLRVYVQKSENNNPQRMAVSDYLMAEKRKKLDSFETYAAFAKKVFEKKLRLIAAIKELREDSKRIAAYGAPAKSTTLLNFCNLTKEDIEYIVDDNALKVGKFAPGTHIPVVNSFHLGAHIPDYLLLLAWNFKDEILKKVERYHEKGMKVIVPLPKFEII